MRTVTLNNKNIYIRILILAVLMTVSAHVRANAGTVYTGSPNKYIIWRSDTEVGENKSQIERSTPFHYDFESDGSVKTTMFEERVLPRGAEKIWWGQPVVECCSACEALASNPDLYSCRIFLEDDQGNEYVSRPGVVLTREDLAGTGIDFDTLSTPLRVGIELVQRPGNTCSVCQKRIGSKITVDNLSIYYPLIKYSSHPASVTVSPGQSATFSVSVSKYTDTAGRQQSEYRWVRWENGGWVDIEDSSTATSDVYTGAATPTLRINNITSALQGARYCCRLKGVWNGASYSDAAVLTVSGSSSGGPQTPPDPGITTPVTTPPGDTGSLPDPIIPGGGGGGSYTPANSTSSYVPVYPTPAGGGNASSSTVTVPGGSGSDDGAYTGALDTPAPGADTPGGSKLTAGDPAGGRGTTGGSKGGSKGGGSSSAKSSLSSSSTASVKKPGKGYVMKNGILYIVDDDQIQAGSSSSGGGDTLSRTDVNEQEYSASDLALEGQLRQQSRTAGFFDTIAGRAVIIAAGIIILLLLLFFLFFGVIVFGEVEEHDEVFELCAVRLMRRREGNWCVRLGEAFDENAVLKLRIGLLFALIFEDWDLTGEVTGMYEGSVTGVIQQKMLLYRKNIRRNV